MARVVRFRELPRANRRMFRTEVDCGYRIVSEQGLRMLHLETYGSQDRQIPGKVSQSLQLDERAAAELLRLIREAFPHL